MSSQHEAGVGDRRRGLGQRSAAVGGAELHHPRQHLGLVAQLLRAAGQLIGEEAPLVWRARFLHPDLHAPGIVGQVHEVLLQEEPEFLQRQSALGHFPQERMRVQPLPDRVAVRPQPCRERFAARRPRGRLFHERRHLSAPDSAM
jgi:hypothetical protein